MRTDPPTFDQDPAAAAWIGPRLTGAWGTVTGPGTVPTGYAAYARLLHPVVVEGGLLSWADFAARTGRRVHPLVQWHRLIGSDDTDGYVNPDVDVEPPEEGNLHPRHLALLLDVLAGHTTTADDCWFGIWDGRGGGGPWREVHDEPWWLGGRSATGGRHLQRPYGLAHLPGRDYHVGRGALWSALAIGEHVDGRFHPQSPNLWWPDDRAWFAATEIDFRWTLVGGTRALVDELLAHDVLEVVEVGPDDAMTVDSDTVN